MTPKRQSGEPTPPDEAQNGGANGHHQYNPMGISAQGQPAFPSDFEGYQEPSYREHVSGGLWWNQAAYPPSPQQYQQPYYAPPQVPQTPPVTPRPIYTTPAAASQPYPVYTNGPHNAQLPYYPYGGYPSAYYGYPPYGSPYAWGPAKPPRDGYLFAMAIISLIASSLAILGGLFCVITLLGVAVTSSVQSGVLPASQLFSSVVLFTSLSVACLVGGSFGLYHSIRSLARKPSAAFKLPAFWIFLVLYVAVAIIGAALEASGTAVKDIPLSILLIALAGVLPALTILALGLRRVSNARERHWPTSWRRFTLAILSGTTSAILFASIIELVLTFAVQRGLGITGFSLDNPNQPIPQDFKTLTFMFLLLSVIAPLVEEGVKPLAVVAMIGRIRSAGEAFVLGLSCGVGFDLIETSGYIGQGYQNWLNVALERSTAGLLHGFGAAMVALGWYYLTHPKASHHRWLLGFGCMAYAVVQHAVWNGTFVLQLLPGPVGSFFNNGKVPLGPLSFSGDLIPYIVLSILMITFFVYVTGKLRNHEQTQPPATTQPQPAQMAPQPMQQQQPMPTRAW